MFQQKHLALLLAIIFSFIVFAGSGLAAVISVDTTDGNSDIATISAPAYNAVVRDWYDPYNYNQNADKSYNKESSGKISGSNYYGKSYFIFYYILTKPDGTQEILGNPIKKDSGEIAGSEVIKNPYWDPSTVNHYYSTINISSQEFPIDVSALGHYKLELKQVEIPAILGYKNSETEYNLDDILENWAVDGVEYYSSYTQTIVYDYGGGFKGIENKNSEKRLCVAKDFPQNQTFSTLSYDYDQKPKGQAEASGTTDCGTVGMKSADYLCNYAYTVSEGSWGDGSRYTTSYRCWIEKPKNQKIKISDIGAKAIWTSEFDVKPHLAITDVKACADINCETSPSFKPNEKIYFELKTSEPASSNLKIFGNFPPPSINEFNLYTNAGGIAQIAENILKVSNGNANNGDAYNDAYGRAVYKRLYNSPADIKWDGKIIPNPRSYGFVSLAFSDIRFYYDGYYKILYAVAPNFAQALPIEYVNSQHSFEIRTEADSITWLIDSQIVAQQKNANPAESGQIIVNVDGGYTQDGVRTTASAEISEISISGNPFELVAPTAGTENKIFEFTPAETGNYNLEFFISADERSDSVSVPIEITREGIAVPLETGSAINPFSQSSGNSENKNSGSGATGFAAGFSALALPALAAGAAAYAFYRTARNGQNRKYNFLKSFKEKLGLNNFSNQRAAQRSLEAQAEKDFSSGKITGAELERMRAIGSSLSTEGNNNIISENGKVSGVFNGNNFAGAYKNNFDGNFPDSQKGIFQNIAGRLGLAGNNFASGGQNIISQFPNPAWPEQAAVSSEWANDNYIREQAFALAEEFSSGKISSDLFKEKMLALAALAKANGNQELAGIISGFASENYNFSDSEDDSIFSDGEFAGENSSAENSSLLSGIASSFRDIVKSISSAGSAGVSLLSGRKREGVVVSNVKSGFTEYGNSQLQKTKDFFSFLEEEKNGYWVKKYQAEQEARQRAARAKQEAEQREKFEKIVSDANKVQDDYKAGMITKKDFEKKINNLNDVVKSYASGNNLQTTNSNRAALIESWNKSFTNTAVVEANERIKKDNERTVKSETPYREADMIGDVSTAGWFGAGAMALTVAGAPVAPFIAFGAYSSQIISGILDFNVSLARINSRGGLQIIDRFFTGKLTADDLEDAVRLSLVPLSIIPDPANLKQRVIKPIVKKHLVKEYLGIKNSQHTLIDSSIRARRSAEKGEEIVIDGLTEGTIGLVENVVTAKEYANDKK